MKDISGIIIYAGKASSLKKRVSSYFRESGHDIKVTALVKHIDDIEYVITDSEVEALILESTLIKKHKPKYNIRLKDDKRYPYIAVTMSEIFPRVIITRKLGNKNDRYFGPYTDVKAARSIVATINSIFKFRLCKKPLPLKSGERPCLNYQMKRCSGLCAGKISREEYLQIVNNSVNFLEGKVQPVLDELTRLMSDYSARQEYEKAARIRDIMFDMNRITETQKVYTPIGTDKDYIGILVQGPEAIIVVFEFRNGILLSRKISIFENIEYSDIEEIMRSFIIDYYRNTDPPSRIITQTGVRDKELAEEYLTKIISKKVHITTPRDAEDKGIINLIGKNLDVIAVDRLAEQTSRDRMKGLLELKEVLSLKNLPAVIECFDISNIQGKNAVASMVRFRDGSPDKTNYRRYKIKAYDTPNDPAMIHEAVARRLQHLVNEEMPLPDLVVIDGGKTQLGRALEVKETLGLDIKIVSIAKRMEEIFTEGTDESILLDRSSAGLKIIQNIRDEAHRFAIGYHKSIRDKELKKSVLEEIPDIGEKKKILLLKHMGSVEKIKSASLEELEKLNGIGKKTAGRIYNYFHRIS